LSSPLLISDRLFFSDFLCCIYYLICQCVSPEVVGFCVQSIPPGWLEWREGNVTNDRIKGN
ncbi:hypothetical protein, partial [Nostoc sp.]|uniref:hypothetical protein n=1 Tax=Nostoc sp. TaxID=1180 RepID=UPI002FF34BAB